MTNQAAIKKEYEYSFIISPDERTMNTVKAAKERLHNLIGLSPENRHSIPHLSLFKLRFGQPVDDIIMTRTRAGIYDIAPMPILIDGYRVFNHGEIFRSLVLNVMNPEPVRLLHKSLTEQFKIKAGKITPHITIAKKLLVDEFEKISGFLPEFNHKGEFTCDKITILKKVIGETKNYQLFQQVGLSGRVQAHLNLQN